MFQLSKGRYLFIAHFSKIEARKTRLHLNTFEFQTNRLKGI